MDEETYNLVFLMGFALACLGFLTIIGLFTGQVQFDLNYVPEMQKLNDFCESKGLVFVERVPDAFYGACGEIENGKIVNYHNILKINKEYVLEDLRDLNGN